MSRSLNSTQMSAACSRGLTRSHTPPIAPSTPPPRPRLPPHPFRGRPVDEAAAISSSDSPLMGYIPSPIQSPVFSPIRSPFSPCGSFPSTPRTPTTKYFVSPIKDSKGARERRRESRPSPLTSLLAAKGIERQVTPRAPALCPECTKVKMLLPAKWCGHQVTPSRMKDGLRVVRINPNFGRTMGVRAQKPRISRRAGLEKAKPVAADSLVDQVEQQTPIVNEPAAVEPSMPERVTSSSIFDEPTVEPSTLERVTSSSVFDEQTVEPSILDRMTSSPVIDEPAVEQSTPSVANSPIIDQPTVEASTPKRVASSPVVESTPKPSTVCSPSIYTPFKNPYLDDQPLHWSPRMFKSEIDRHNWTWSEWDSPSGTIEDVTYQTEDWPANDPFARYPPHIRDRLREVLAMKPQRTRASDSAERKSAERRSVERKEAEGFSTIPIRLEDFLPSSSSNKPTDSKSEDLSTWVLIDDHPWSPTLLQMYIDGEKDREREAARRKQFKPNDNTSTVSSLATVDFLAEIYYPGSSRSGSNHSESNHSGSIRAGSIRSEPNRSGSIHSDHNCSERIRSKSSRSGSVRSRSHGSGSVGMSSLLDLSSVDMSDLLKRCTGGNNGSQQQLQQTEEKSLRNSSPESVSDPVPNDSGSIRSRSNRSTTSRPGSNRSGSIRSESIRSEPNHPEPTRSGSNGSGSAGMSDLLDLSSVDMSDLLKRCTGGNNDGQQQQTEEKSLRNSSPESVSDPVPTDSGSIRSRSSHSGSNRSGSIRSEPNHSEPSRPVSNGSGSVGMSSLNSLSESVSDRAPSRPDAPVPSTSIPDVSIISVLVPGVSIPSASILDVSPVPVSVPGTPTLQESVPDASILSVPVPDMFTISSSVLGIPSNSEPAPDMPTLPESVPDVLTLPAPVAEASTLSQPPEEFSSWIDLDTRKWTDLTFRFYTRQEEARQMGLYDNGTDDADSDSDCSDSFDLSDQFQKVYGITSTPQQHFRSLREAQQPSAEVPLAVAQISSVASPSSTARRELPSATVMQPWQSPEESCRESGFGWKSLACVAVTAAAVGAGLAYAWFSGNSI